MVTAALRADAVENDVRPTPVEKSGVNGLSGCATRRRTFQRDGADEDEAWTVDFAGDWSSTAMVQREEKKWPASSRYIGRGRRRGLGSVFASSPTRPATRLRTREAPRAASVSAGEQRKRRKQRRLRVL
jgi:hypothetical protein